MAEYIREKEEITSWREGSYLAFAEGRDFLFQIQYGWRPRTQDEHDSNLPWRISAEASLSYLNAIKDTILCGGTSEPAC
ncbi:hypothetical protein GJ698_28590 [Pseudoduganella sp. FT26W]|uniref:Uncharacterized protein n=1 Tax=Duganella aquatilis TaxID=2666082 RepID=A0A844DGS5_9BURK|nr:hypothetical protein [Duganella aquatilis]MRW88040.1 hypothetical protein [Duganella aquatilis]